MDTLAAPAGALPPPPPAARRAAQPLRRSPLAPPPRAPSPSACPTSDGALVAAGLDAAERLLHRAAQLAARTRRDLSAAAGSLERAAEESGAAPAVAGGGVADATFSASGALRPTPRAPAWASPAPPSPPPRSGGSKDEARQRLAASLARLRGLAPSP
jgi:hypothetical protein